MALSFNAPCIVSCQIQLLCPWHPPLLCPRSVVIAGGLISMCVFAWGHRRDRLAWLACLLSPCFVVAAIVVGVLRKTPVAVVHALAAMNDRAQTYPSHPLYHGLTV